METIDISSIHNDLDTNPIIYSELPEINPSTNEEQINNNDFEDIKYDSVNGNLYYTNNEGKKISASKINLKIPPFKLWGDDIENGNSIACSINDKCICKADLCSRLGNDYHWSNPAGDQICNNIKTGEILNHKDLCDKNKGIFKSSDCFTQQNVDCTA